MAALYTDHEFDHEFVSAIKTARFLWGIGELYARRYPHGGAGDQGVYRPVRISDVQTVVAALRILN